MVPADSFIVCLIRVCVRVVSVGALRNPSTMQSICNCWYCYRTAVILLPIHSILAVNHSDPIGFISSSLLCGKQAGFLERYRNYAEFNVSVSRARTRIKQNFCSHRQSPLMALTKSQIKHIQPGPWQEQQVEATKECSYSAPCRKHSAELY